MSNSGASLKENIMSDAQVSNIRSSAIGWITPKIRRKISEFLNAVSFELITDGKCWLRGSGIITVSMRIELGQFKHAGQPQDIKVYSSYNSFYDSKDITDQLADILDEYLLSQKHIARIQFADGTRDEMKESWQTQAVEWLVDDIRDDTEVLKHLICRSEKGSKIVVGNSFGRDSFELDIKFQDGECWFAIMADQLSGKIDKRYNVSNLLAQNQLTVGEKAMAPAIVNTIRDGKYCHPYSQDTKNKLLEMSEYIKIAADNIPGVSALALAGAVADALDDNVKEYLQQDYDLMRRYLLEAVKRHSGELSFLIDILLEIISKGNPEPISKSAFIAVKTIWSFLNDETKSEILVFAADFIRGAIRYPIEESKKSNAAQRDEHSDVLASLVIMNQIDLNNVSEEQRARASNFLDKKLDEVMNPERVLCCNLVGHSPYVKNLLQNAKVIEKLLNGHGRIPEERYTVTKWERFYSHFK